MFQPFPSFEELPIRVEVEWQKQTRFVVARIEQLPSSPPGAAVVCSFEDAPEQGQWLIANSACQIYTLGNPFHLLRLRTLYAPGTHATEEMIDLNPARVQKLQGVIQRALSGSERGLQILRAVECDLPRKPRIALLQALAGVWCDEWKSEKLTPFTVPERDATASDAATREWLHRLWNDSQSDAHFAWEWAQWNDDERLRRLGTSESERAGARQLMRQVLSCAPSLWAQDSGWSWSLRPDHETGSLWNHSHRDIEVSDLGFDPGPWERLILRCFASNWRADWIAQHLCVREFWQWRNLFEVELDAPPTSHELLEARLELREWLEHNAAPDEIERLLSPL